jgi:hypothetical protein
VFLALVCACAKKPEPPKCAPRVLEVARAAERPTLDGKIEEEMWHRTPNTGALSEASNGKLIVTHTEIRALWDDAGLYVAWYAADEDIGSKDLLVAVLNGRRFELGPSTHTATTVVDSDGTLDDPRDDDEEWTAEQVISWKELGFDAAPAELTADFLRDDQPKGSIVRHQRWNAQCPGAPGLLRLKR